MTTSTFVIVLWTHSTVLPSRVVFALSWIISSEVKLRPMDALLMLFPIIVPSLHTFITVSFSLNWEWRNTIWLDLQSNALPLHTVNPPPTTVHSNLSSWPRQVHSFSTNSCSVAMCMPVWLWTYSSQKPHSYITPFKLTWLSVLLVYIYAATMKPRKINCEY